VINKRPAAAYAFQRAASLYRLFSDNEKPAAAFRELAPDDFMLMVFYS
jgi:hypothetical protein